MKRMIAWFLGLALAAGCAKAPTGNLIRFRYWGDLDEIRIIDSLIKEFEAAHPGVRVKQERSAPPASAYAEVLMTEFAAHRAPDVIFCVAEIKDLLSENGLLEDLEPFLAKEKDFSKKDFYASIVERFSTDGKLLVLPRDIAPFACVYYNKALFKKAGAKLPSDNWTWQELRQDAIKIAALPSGGRDKIWGFVDDWPMPEPWVLSSGGKLVDDTLHPHRLVMDSPEALRGYLFRWDLMFSDHVMPSGADTQALSNGSTGLFLNGFVGMFYSGIWKTPGFRAIKDFDWDIAEFPKGPSGKRGFLTGGAGYGIRKGCERKDLAWELASFMSGPHGQEMMASTGLAQPAMKRIAASKVFLDGQKPLNKKMLLQAAEIATHPPATSAWLKYDGDVATPILGQIWIPGFARADVAAKVKEAVAMGNKKYFPAP